jgi:hypothetical protein
LSSEVLISITGLEAAEGFITIPAAIVTPEAKTFQAQYVQKYGIWESAILDLTSGYDIFMDAMKMADSVEVDEVLAKLHTGGPFDTIVGPALIGGKELYGIDNQIFIPLGLTQIKNGVGVTMKVFSAEEQVELVRKWTPK